MKKSQNWKKRRNNLNSKFDEHEEDQNFLQIKQTQEDQNFLRIKLRSRHQAQVSKSKSKLRKS